MSYNQDRLTEIANAIRAKQGTVAPIKATDFATAIGMISGGGTPTYKYYIRFLDYDGTVVSELGADEGGSVVAPTLQNLPATAIRPALTFEGWNYTAEDLTNINMDIEAGAIYVPTDGKTHAVINLNEATGLTIPIIVTKPSAGILTVEYGDGTSATFTGTGTITATHTYVAGTYTVKVSISTGTYSLGGGNSSNVFIGGVNQNLRDALVYCYTGVGCVELKAYSVYHLHALRVITLNSQLVSVLGYNFSFCYALKNLCFPRGTTNSSAGSLFNAFSLASISLPVTYNSLYGFTNLYSLKSLCLSKNTSYIANGTISHLKSLKKLIFPESLTQFSSSAVYNLPSLEYLEIRGAVTYINGVTTEAYGLKTLIISNPTPVLFQSGSGIFSLAGHLDDSVQIVQGTTAVSGIFYNNFSRTYIDIPTSVTSIGAQAFAGCSGLKYILCRPTSVPTLASISAFTDVPASCPIYVPDASVAAYKVATNWATYALRIRPLSEFII